jgi:hypothetical protein
MHSPRMLGMVALGAIVVAAISFAIVDASIASANGCVRGAIRCDGHTVPVIAITFAALGAFSLIVSVFPAVLWVVEAIARHQAGANGHAGADLQFARDHRPRRMRDEFDGEHEVAADELEAIDASDG